MPVRTRSVVLVGPAAGYRGGIVHYTRLLLEALARRHRASLVGFTRSYPAWLYPGARSTEPAPIADAHAAAGIDWLDPRSWEDVVQRIRAAHADVVIVSWWTAFWALPYWWLLRRLRNATSARLVVLCHNVVPHENRAPDRWGARAVLRQADVCLVHSEAEAGRLRALLPRMPVHVIRHPVYDTFASAGITRAVARERLGLTDAPDGVLLFFGLVRKYKGLEHLLHALALLARDGRRPTLVIAGEFWEDRAAYDALIGSLGLRAQVRTSDGYVPDDRLETYFSACDVVVLPYVSVTGSGAAQMARGFRRPIVASDIGDLRHAVKEGVNGYLVPPADPAGLAAAIARALDTRAALERGAAALPVGASWDDLVRAIERAAGLDSEGAP